MKTFFHILVKFFNLLLFPFKGLPMILGFSVTAIITGFLAVVIFKYVSNQKKLKEIMGKIKLRFTEILLYKDDFRQILRAQREILKLNLNYFLRTIIPAIPIVLMVLTILSQINIRYSLHPLSPEDPITVQAVHFPTPQSQDPYDIQLILPKGFQMITPAFHLPGSDQIEWRIQGMSKGEFTLIFKAGEESYPKKIIIGNFNGPFSPHLGKQGLVEYIFNPLETPLPKEAPIKSIDLAYPALYFNLGVFGLKVHWLVAFLVIAIVFGLICRKLLKVS